MITLKNEATAGDSRRQVIASAHVSTIHSVGSSAMMLVDAFDCLEKLSRSVRNSCSKVKLHVRSSPFSLKKYWRNAPFITKNTSCATCPSLSNRVSFLYFLSVKKA